MRYLLRSLVGRAPWGAILAFSVMVIGLPSTGCNSKSGVDVVRDDGGVDRPVPIEGDARAPDDVVAKCEGIQDGTACDDLSACTSRDICVGGFCVGYEPVVCATDNVCEAAGSCDPMTGKCSAPTPLSADVPCDDASACTKNDRCLAGRCTGDVLTTCQASQCQQPGVCDPSSGTCSAATSKPDGTICDDGNGCTVGDTCRAGLCAGGPAVTCPAGTCQRAVCDPTTGHCKAPEPLMDGTACDDGDLCTSSSSCVGGTCVGKDRKTCGDGNPCSTTAGCDPRTGACVSGPVPDSTRCEDGNACTVMDSCQGGLCRPGIARACPVTNGCRVPVSCDMATGACPVGTARENGSRCDDGNLCTDTDICMNGECVGSAPVICNNGDACRDNGTCNPATGKCGAPMAKPDKTACNDGDVCTRLDECRAGNCVGTNPIECRVIESCQASSACNRETGQCVAVNRPPMLNRPVAPGRQADTLLLTGRNLTGVRVLLAGRQLEVIAMTDTQVGLKIPRDHAIGEAELVAQTPCGEDRVSVQITAHPPVILSVKPEAAVPDGVLMVTADFVEGDRLSMVKLGTATVFASDPGNFAWDDTGGQSGRVFGVRVPPDTPAGSLALTLVGPAGPSEARQFDVRDVTTLMPPAPNTVMFNPRVAANDKVFPIARNSYPGPYHVIDAGGQSAGWRYLWRFTDPGVYPSCRGEGTVAGVEKYCIGPDCGDPFSRRCEAPATCHPISGTWKLNATSNQIDVVIDRTSSGGSSERYLGGWRRSDGRPPTAGTSEGFFVVIRSQVTGRQIAISQASNAIDCDRKVYDPDEHKPTPE